MRATRTAIFKPVRRAAALLAVSCIAACGAFPATAATTAAEAPPVQTVWIGVSVALTGISSAIAENVVNSARLAVQDANRRKIIINHRRVHFDLLVQDDRDDNNRALIAARYLNLAGVAGVIGNIGTGASLATARTYEDAGIAHISPTANGRALTQQGYRTAFRLPGHDADGCALLGEFAVHTLSLTKVVVISNGTAFGNSLAQYCGQAFKDSGGELLYSETVKSRTSDFNQALSRARDADAIFLAGFSEQAPAAANAIKRLGLKAHLVTALSGVAVDGGFLRDTGPGAGVEGAIAMENGIPMERLPGVRELQAAYSRKFEGELSLYGVYAYDATATMIAAMQQADSTDRAKIVETLHKIKFKGLSGTIAFNAEGDASPTFTIYEVRKGKWVPLKIYGGNSNR